MGSGKWATTPPLGTPQFPLSSSLCVSFQPSGTGSHVLSMPRVLVIPFAPKGLVVGTECVGKGWMGPACLLKGSASVRNSGGCRNRGRYFPAACATATWFFRTEGANLLNLMNHLPSFSPPHYPFLIPQHRHRVPKESEVAKGQEEKAWTWRRPTEGFSLYVGVFLGPVKILG